MTSASDGEGPVDEFDWIDRCLRPLARDAPEALDLLDDAAVLPSRPGWDLVLSADTIVETVHFRSEDPLDLVARKLLRVNLSDLAAKGAEPYGYLLTVTWPERLGWPARRAFADGLGQDQRVYGLRLLGGDTTAGPGPLTAGVTILGWTPSGALTPRAGARAGDVVLASGTIGDGWLGLAAADGLLQAPAPAAAWLADRYRLPRPRLGLAAALRAHAHAAADVSDGLIADAGRIARASGVAIDLDLDRMPLSPPAAGWLAARADPVQGLLDLAAGGDDYEIVCTASPEGAAALAAAGAAVGIPLAEVGRVRAGQGVAVFARGQARAVTRAGYRHG